MATRSYFPTPRSRSPRRLRIILLAAVIILLLVFGRSICALVIDYMWWREMGQVSTWLRMSAYRYFTGIAEWLIVFAVLWLAHARGMKYADTSLREQPLYARLSTLVLAVVSLIIAAALMDGWTVARYAAGRGMETAWSDPVFGRPLGFYFFELPFYRGLVGMIETLALASALVYYLAARFWQVRLRFPEVRQGLAFGRLDWGDLRALGKLETGMLQLLIAGFLVALAVYFWLDRYELLYSDHGNLLVGIDYVQQHLNLPLQYVKAGAAILAAILVLMGRRRLALACVLVLVVDFALPPLVSSLYVKPNELALEKPFIGRHIEATRSAFGLDRRAKEQEFIARKDGTIDFARNASMLDNVRLWDWRAFHDTLSQTQPLRPYAYADTDVDRYKIGGELRQTLLAPRELDLSQLGEAQNSWINANLTFTHGYGLVLAEASRISPSGLPDLLIKDAPVQVSAPGLKVTRPEIYYSEATHEPVFVDTTYPEFNYPSGSGDVPTRYSGTGGFPIGSEGLRLIASIGQGDWNIVLTSAFMPESRMLIHRRVLDRLGTLASFIRWDGDPYLVIAADGRLVWMADGYLTSDAHPYARAVETTDGENYNYIRNSIKATVDAYNGTARLYVFDPEDPLIRAYQRLFPDLFTSASEMPADLRAHARAPETLFRVQAEMYRTYHMRDPESFYNRADLWDLASYTQGQNATVQTVSPTYMIMTLPGETSPEFVLTTPFTPRAKQNLIGLMVARCDGPHLGEIVFLQLPKQEIIPGPLQIEALINQDQVISKDLTLWNQQGSQVLRAQILTLPIDQTFLFVAPIYIQASQARMPQLEKVALAVGNTLVYENTYEQALKALEAIQKGRPVPAAAPAAISETSAGLSPSPPPSAPAGTDPRIAEIRSHIDRYRQLSAQGKWSEAGKELEAIEAIVKK
ncbi:MAG TPA: UPF0182 family protein [Bryobacteraceae bacterium]